MMFQEGKVKNYQAERGFGFIQVDGESRDLFFHIKDMPNRNIQPQIGEKLKFRIVEEKGKFKADNIVRLDLRSDDKFEPVGQQYQSSGQTANPVNCPPAVEKSASTYAKLFTLIGAVIIAILAFLLYGKIQEYNAHKAERVQQMVLEQEKIIAKQRQAQGNLPDRVLSEQGHKNLENHPEVLIGTRPKQDVKNNEITKQASSKPIDPKCYKRTRCGQMTSRSEAEWFVRNCPNNEMDGDGDGIPCENDSRW